MKGRPIILASASPRRVQLLRRMGVRFRAVPSNVEEIPHGHLTPRELAVRHALAKARAVAKQFPDAVVIGADTIVVLGGRIYGKPRDIAHAERIIRKLQGRTHQVITGVCVLQWSCRERVTFSEATDVTFRKLTLAQVRSYLRHINPLDKAGAYAAQEHAELIIERVEGDFDNVVGLPVTRLKKALEQLSVP